MSEKIPHARRLILPPNESSKENELVVRKFQWSDIMTEVWEWSELDAKQKLLVAALHNQSQCFIKSTEKDGKTTYKLLMRKPDGKVACLIEPFDISEVFKRTRSKEKKSPQKDSKNP